MDPKMLNLIIRTPAMVPLNYETPAAPETSAVRVDFCYPVRANGRCIERHA